MSLPIQMLAAALLGSLFAPGNSPGPAGAEAREAATAGVQRSVHQRQTAGKEVVQTGLFFTGVIQGTQTFVFPLTLQGFDPELGELLSVQVTLDARMSGEYTIQPTPVPPNGTVTADATTALSAGGKALATTVHAFAPIPWVFPVNLPLAVLWALDQRDVRTLTDGAALAGFVSSGPLTLEGRVDLATKVDPPGWASPHLAGVLGTWEVRYTYR